MLSKVNTVTKAAAFLAIGAGAGVSWSAFQKFLLYKGWFASKNGFTGSSVMCVKHPGNGLLMWSNGDLQCYKCGQIKYSQNSTVKPKPNRGVYDRI